MLNKRFAEIVVGLFMVAGMLALLALAFKVSSLGQYSASDSFTVKTAFDNIGDLKVRAPVTIAGVRVGEVHSIDIDPQTFKAVVAILIDKRQTNLPIDSSASILTAGLIGANYIQITPGFSDEVLKNGGEITETHPAIILEDLIGQVMYQIKGDKSDKGDKEKNKDSK